MTPKPPDRKAARKAPVRAPLDRGVSPRQWLLPAGYTQDSSRLVTLDEVLSPDTATKELAELTEQELAQLTMERIKKQRQFKIALLGVGLIGKARAVTELKAQSPVGRVLVDIEKRTLARVINAARVAAQASATPQDSGHGGAT